MNPTPPRAELPEMFSLADHGKDCGNAIRFEIYQGKEMVASIEVEDHREAKQLGAFIVEACNSHTALVQALEACRNAMLGKVNPANPAWELSSQAIKSLTPYEPKS